MSPATYIKSRILELEVERNDLVEQLKHLQKEASLTENKNAFVPKLGDLHLQVTVNKSLETELKQLLGVINE